MDRKDQDNPLVAIVGVIVFILLTMAGSVSLWQDAVVTFALYGVEGLIFFAAALTVLLLAAIPIYLWLNGGSRLATMVLVRLGWRKLLVAGLILTGLFIASQVCQLIPVVGLLVGYRWLYGVGQFAIRP